MLFLGERWPTIYLLSFGSAPAPPGFVLPGPGVDQLYFHLPFPVVFPFGSADWRSRWATRRGDRDRRVLVWTQDAAVGGHCSGSHSGADTILDSRSPERNGPFSFILTLVERGPLE